MIFGVGARLKPITVKRFVFFILTFFLLLPLIHAQKKDSTVILSSTAGDEVLSIKYSSQKADTVIDNFFNYHQTGVLGNIGLPSYSLLAKENTQSSGFFNWMNLNNQNDLFTANQPIYFYPQGKIYTKVLAVMGQKQEKVFKILH